MYDILDAELKTIVERVGRNLEEALQAAEQWEEAKYLRRRGKRKLITIPK